MQRLSFKMEPQTAVPTLELVPQPLFSVHTMHINCYFERLVLVCVKVAIGTFSANVVDRVKMSSRLLVGL